ncbi:MAG: hypothetical protein JWP87_1544 [Labilithrix sp.]|nr:hypothetical protein [Labilithrix sp.]
MAQHRVVRVRAALSRSLRRLRRFSIPNSASCPYHDLHAPTAAFVGELAKSSSHSEHIRREMTSMPKELGVDLSSWIIVFAREHLKRAQVERLTSLISLFDGGETFGVVRAANSSCDAARRVMLRDARDAAQRVRSA